MDPINKKPSHVSIFLPAPWIRHGIGLNREKTGRSNPWTNNPTPPDAAPWADALAASPAAVCRKCCATSHLSSSVEAPRSTGCFMTREELPPLNNPSTMTNCVLMAACLEVGLPAKTKHVCFFVKSNKYHLLHPFAIRMATLQGILIICGQTHVKRNT